VDAAISACDAPKKTQARRGRSRVFIGANVESPRAPATIE
jgi:hypothetical protein